MRVLLAGAVAAAVTLSGCSAFQTDRARTVAKGADKAQLGKFYLTMSDCKGAPLVLKIVKQADHGFAMIESTEAKVMVADSVSGKASNSCAGAKVPAKRVVYTPNDGYTGPDSVKVHYENMANAKTSNTVGYTIMVK